MKPQTQAQAKRLGLFLIMLSAMLWGTVGIFVQAIYHLSATNPLSIAFFRLALSLPVLFLAAQLTLKRPLLQIARRDLTMMLLVGVMTALYHVCYFGAIAYIGVAAATLITLCTVPVWVALLAFGLLRERLSAGVVTAGFFALMGTVFLVRLTPDESISQTNPAMGVLLAISSAIGYAIVTLCSRSLSKRYHPLQSLTVGFSTGTVILLPFALLNGFVIDYPLAGWAFLLYLGVVPTALAYLLYFSGIQQTTATIASLLILLEPLTATVLAGWLFGERLDSLGFLGAVLLLGAIAILYWENVQQNDR